MCRQRDDQSRACCLLHAFTELNSPVLSLWCFVEQGSCNDTTANNVCRFFNWTTVTRRQIFPFAMRGLMKAVDRCGDKAQLKQRLLCLRRNCTLHRHLICVYLVGKLNLKHWASLLCFTLSAFITVAGVWQVTCYLHCAQLRIAKETTEWCSSFIQFPTNHEQR